MSDTLGKDGITEFLELDPTELHLVGMGANGYDPLLAKARATVADVIETAGDLTKARWAGFCAEPKCLFCKERFGQDFEDLLAKAKLKQKDRDALPSSAFALPDTREYPIHDENHAHAALSMLHNASPEEQKKIKAAVRRRYPNIKMEKKMKRAKKDGAPQSAHEDRPLPSPDESQTRENHPHMGPVHIDVQPNGAVTVTPPFSGHPAPSADQEGHGSTAPDKGLPTGEAESQTRANLRKADGDGKGDPAPDGDADDTAAEREGKRQTEENHRKAHAILEQIGQMTPDELSALTGLAKSTPGDPAWEAEDAQLAEEAGALIDRLASREKAEQEAGPAGACKVSAETQETILRMAKALGERGARLEALAQPTSKEIDEMNADELVKFLDERDARQATATKEAKQAKKDKARKKARKAKSKMKAKTKAEMAEMSEKARNGDPEAIAALKALTDAKAARKAAKATGDPTVLAALLKSQEETRALVEKVASQPQPLPGVLGAAGIEALGGAAAFARGAGVPAGTTLTIKDRAPGEEWSVDGLRKAAIETGVIPG